MSACCNEYGCRRKKPIMLMFSELTKSWYVVTDYTERSGDGEYRAKTKHQLNADQSDQLTRMQQAYQESKR